MTDMRASFRAVLNKYGYNVFLQRRLSAYEVDNAVFERQLEKHTVRSTYPRKTNLENAANEASEGITHDYDQVFYFMHDAVPKRGDRIYEEYFGRPNNTATYLIDESLPMRGEQGEIVFWTVGATQETHKREG